MYHIKAKKYVIEWFVDVAIMCAILLVVQFVWQGLEVLFDGGIQPSVSDTIIGIVLVISIRRNLNWKVNYIGKQGSP